jgi:hypothetical protein
LVDGDAIRPELDRLDDVTLPVCLGFLEHAGNQVDVDLGEILRPRAFVRSVDFTRPMSPAVDLQYMVVEILDAQTQTRYTDVLDRGEFSGI